jgi:hypothetical protein
MFSGWFGKEGDKDGGAEGGAPPGLFTEYPHPENWRAIVDELFARFGPAGEQIPLDMCPCGGRKAGAYTGPPISPPCAVFDHSSHSKHPLLSFMT